MVRTHPIHLINRISGGFFLIFTTVFTFSAFSQISEGGRPASFDERTFLPELKSIQLAPPSIEILKMEDEEALNSGRPPRVGVAVPVGLSVLENGLRTTLTDGTVIHRIMLHCPGALAMSVSFSDFFLPDGSRLFLYDARKEFIIGAFTSANNKAHRLFSTQLVPGDSVIIEYQEPAIYSGDPSLDVDNISYAYRYVPSALISRGQSGACEVNINCPEGDQWQDQKRGVARIYLKDGNEFYWCSGSLVNNTLRNREPYFLTADHCAPDLSPQDLAQWIFYFGFEAPGCENPVNPPSANKTMNGGTLLSHANTDGSDFMLLLLDDMVPESYNPFFNGWSREETASPSGAAIHHPQGDIMKISTYTQPLRSSSWHTFPGTHWEVFWTETENGWGVTEPGSSGGPIFDNNGRLVGTLTGGLADCEPGGEGVGTGPDKPDYFGKFSFSWDKNGPNINERLKEWLDPGATGLTAINGINAILSADFISDSRIILVGREVNFIDNSSGDPKTWTWHFEGGLPDSYEGDDPPSITYPNAGWYDVSLVVSRDGNSDTLLFNDYVRVVGKIYPNPAIDVTHIFLDENPPSYVKIELFNLLGVKLYSEERLENADPIITIDVSHLTPGMYPVRIQVGQEFLVQKVSIVRWK